MKAVIFDMDGVIVDSEYHWKKAELALFKKLLPKWEKDDQQKIIGMNVHETYRILTNDYGLFMTHKEFMEKINGVAITVCRDKANLIEGFMELITRLKSENIKTALASSSLTEWIDITMERFNLRPFFDVIISSEDVNNIGKPAPDIYLFTAKKLGVSPKDCIAIEDSKNGVISAKSAGMYCVGFRNGFNGAQDLSAADAVIMGFREFNLDILKN